MITFSNASARASAFEAAFGAMGLGASSLPDVCVVLGGDGAMLRAIQAYGPAYAYFGVNCGHLGFLMNDLPGEETSVAAEVVRILEEGRYVGPHFPRLHMRATTATGPAEARALNDVYVERQVGQTCHLRVTVDEVEVVGAMVCDGIIAATALGSTAYTISAGGPAAHPLLRAIHLTPICPHTPRLASLVLPLDARIRIEALDPTLRRARAVADGIPFDDARVVEIARADDEVRLLFREGHDFTTTLVRKIIHA